MGQSLTLLNHRETNITVITWGHASDVSMGCGKSPMRYRNMKVVTPTRSVFPEAETKTWQEVSLSGTETKGTPPCPHVFLTLSSLSLTTMQTTEPSWESKTGPKEKRDSLHKDSITCVLSSYQSIKLWIQVFCLISTFVLLLISQKLAVALWKTLHYIESQTYKSNSKVSTCLLHSKDWFLA